MCTVKHDDKRCPWLCENACLLMSGAIHSCLTFDALTIP